MLQRLQKTPHLIFFLFLCSFAFAQANPDEMKTHFVTTWQTSHPGTSGPTSLTLTVNPKFRYSYDVDWNNDGVFDEFSLTGPAQHDFSKPGIYTIRIRGEYPALQLTRKDHQKLLRVEQWGSTQWSSLEKAFMNASNLTITATDVPDLSQTTSLASAFESCSSVNPDVSQWDVSKVKDMSYLFSHCAKAEPDVSQWKTSSLKKTNHMFSGTNCNPDVSQWMMAYVEDMSGMFYGTSKANPDVRNWRTSSLSDMGGMFTNARKADPDFSSWSFHSLHSDNKYFDFTGSSLSPKNYDIFLGKFAKYKNLWGAYVNVGSLRSANPEGARHTLSEYYGWKISDGDS